MTDESANPVGSADVAETEAPTPELAADTSDNGQEAPEIEPGDHAAEPDGEAAEPPEEYEEYEHDGKKHKIPKALKPLLMMQADYTRKTQEVAEARKALEAEKQAVAQHAETVKANLGAYAELSSVDRQIAEYGQVDWQRLEEADPVKAGQLFRQYQLLRERREGIAQNIAADERKRSHDAQLERAKRIEEARTVLQREIPNWGPETQKKLTDFGRQVGFDEQELGAVDDPRAIKVLYLASLGQQVLQKTTAPAKPQAQKPQPVQTLGGGKVSPSKDIAKMSMSEYAEHMNRLERNSRR